MIAEDSTLADVCFAVSAALDASGMPAVLTGGSAAAVYAPQTYTSYHADFVLTNDDPLEKIVIALQPIGFQRAGRSRIFTHANSRFTVDFPKGPTTTVCPRLDATDDMGFHQLLPGGLQAETEVS